MIYHYHVILILCIIIFLFTIIIVVVMLLLSQRYWHCNQADLSTISADLDNSLLAHSF